MPSLVHGRHAGGGDVETGFALGSARINDLGGTASTDYYHTDMLGTTRFLTDASGGQIEPAVYTAFGELVSGTSGRFGYVGAHGYQTSDEMPYQHVGNRYYDPTTGRFLQRDPIGIMDGTSVYSYVLNSPTILVDPSGLSFLGWVKKGLGVLKSALQKYLGGSSPWSKVTPAITTPAQALGCGPDVVRIWVGVGHRNKSIRNGTSADDMLDRYDRGHGKYVKPGNGN